MNLKFISCSFNNVCHVNEKATEIDIQIWHLWQNHFQWLNLCSLCSMGLLTSLGVNDCFKSMQENSYCVLLLSECFQLHPTKTLLSFREICHNYISLEAFKVVGCKFAVKAKGYPFPNCRCILTHMQQTPFENNVAK